jgi:hypothetical protein
MDFVHCPESSLTRGWVSISLYNCFCALPGQSLSGSSPARLRPYFTLIFETPPIWRARSPDLHPQVQGGPVIPPGTGFPFVDFYDSQGYSGGILTRLHMGTTYVKVKFILRPTVCLSVRHPYGTRDQIFPFSLQLFFDSCGFVDVGRPDEKSGL